MPWKCIFKDPMNEKRKEHRLRAALAVTLTDAKGMRTSGVTSNISRLGAFVEARAALAVGSAVTVVLGIPSFPGQASALTVTARATVFRLAARKQQSGFGLGIFFTGFAAVQDQQRLSAYIDYLVSQEELGVKQEIARRKAREPEMLGLLQDISRRLDEISAQISELKKR